MTKETEALAIKIKEAREVNNLGPLPKKTEHSGYRIVTEVIVNLFGCVLVGTSLGVISNNLFSTSDKFTVFLALLGGIAGVWSVIKYAISLDKGCSDK